ncbi:MAG: hypothetical protein AAFX85_14160, partial [Pseudomonadota bacterium]
GDRVGEPGPASPASKNLSCDAPAPGDHRHDGGAGGVRARTFVVVGIEQARGLGKSFGGHALRVA